ncbi:MAG: cell division protein FtsL [Deltaproteobacteria bacterium]|nr:cell division protein FtsL [Deltaproteobacteria bacterium]
MSRSLTMTQTITRRQNVRRVSKPLVSFTRWEWIVIGALLGVTLVCLLLAVWSSAQRVHLGRLMSTAIYERQNLANERNANLVELHHLTNPGRLEGEARRLGLVVPTSQQIVNITTDYAKPTNP